MPQTESAPPKAFNTLAEEIQRLERRRRLYTFGLILLSVAILVSGYAQVEEMNSGTFWEGLLKFFEYPGEIVEEAWRKSDEFGDNLIRFAPALLETLNIAAMATLIGGLGAMIFAFMGAANIGMWPPLIPVARRIMDVMRAIPELILALFLIHALSIGPVPAMIAIAFHTTGALGKQFSEVNENIDQKPIEGLRSVGANWLQRMKFGALPQVLPNYLSYFLLRFEINVRASAILGYVGAGGLGEQLHRSLSWGQGRGDETAALFALLIASIFIIDQISSYLRARLTEGAPLSATVAPR